MSKAEYDNVPGINELRTQYEKRIEKTVKFLGLRNAQGILRDVLPRDKWAKFESGATEDGGIANPNETRGRTLNILQEARNALDDVSDPRLQEQFEAALGFENFLLNEDDTFDPVDLAVVSGGE